MSETDASRIRDILQAIGHIKTYCRGVSESTFLLEPQLQDAVIRRLTSIGESAGKLSPAVRRHYAGVDWESMIGMRNILVHDYGRSSVPIVWNTVVQYLPVLEKVLRDK